MSAQREDWRFRHIGFIILPVNQLVSCGAHRPSFRGLDRYPGLPFSAALPDDPEPLQDLYRQQVKGFVDCGGDFFQEAGKASEVCAELNVILRSLCARGESFGSFDAEYEVVGCNIEDAGREVAERICGRSLPLSPLFEYCLGYDVAWASGSFSAIRHGLFGLTRWLDGFLVHVNEHGLFPEPDLADRFREAYRASPSQEMGELFVHELFCPRLFRSER
jgi:hypothetical protein